MAQDRAVAAGSRWQEWFIAAAIVALAVIGIASIWGGSIQRWIDSSSGERSEPAKPDLSSGPSGSRL